MLKNIQLRDFINMNVNFELHVAVETIARPNAASSQHSGGRHADNLQRFGDVEAETLYLERHEFL